MAKKQRHPTQAHQLFRKATEAQAKKRLAAIKAEVEQGIALLTVAATIQEEPDKELYPIIGALTAVLETVWSSTQDFHKKRTTTVGCLRAMYVHAKVGLLPHQGDKDGVPGDTSREREDAGGD